MKSCGSCDFFIKVKNNKHIVGLCNKFDYVVSSDSKIKCQSHTPAKFNRKLKYIKKDN